MIISAAKDNKSFPKMEIFGSFVPKILKIGCLNLQKKCRFRQVIADRLSKSAKKMQI